MYLEFFGLKEKPFNVTPDPHFLYMSPSHQEAFANLLYGVQERKGFVTLSGEVGTGKTTLLHNLLGNLEDNTESVFVFHTGLEFTDLLEMIHHELGIEIKSTSRAGMLQTLNHYLIEKLREGVNVALLIDEAQNLSPEILENLRLLSNLETSKDKLLQIILVGQPELEEKLALDELRQLRQRISVRSRIEALSHEDCRAYILHRISVAGVKPGATPIFSDEALDAIITYSNGIPRQLNILCDSTLLIAYAEGDRHVKAKHVEEALSDQASATSPTASSRSKKPKRLEVVAASSGSKELQRKKRWPFVVVPLLIMLPILLYGSYYLGQQRGEGEYEFQTGDIALSPQPVADERQEASVPPPVNREIPAESDQVETVVDSLPNPRATDAQQNDEPETLRDAIIADIYDSASEEAPLQPIDAPASDLKRRFWATRTETELAALLNQCSRRVYMVSEGDYFTRVIFNETGRQDAMVVDQIMEMNPHIADYDHIEPGWILYLPDFGE